MIIPLWIKFSIKIHRRNYINLILPAENVVSFSDSLSINILMSQSMFGGVRRQKETLREVGFEPTAGSS